MSCTSSVATELTKVDGGKGKSRLGKSKFLRFEEGLNKMFPIPHLDDLSLEEVRDIWYESSDYAEIKSSYQMTIFLMENGELVEGDEHTARGLEYRTQQGAWARYENKRDAYNAVLDEQDRQWKLNKDDFDEISNVYLEHSTKCAEAAAMRGEQDALEAKEICSDLLKRRRSKVRRKKSGHSKKSSEEERPVPPPKTPSVGKVRALLRDQSFSRRDQILNDIEQSKSQALKKAASQRRLNRIAAVAV
jgi:hypothetical protein